MNFGTKPETKKKIHKNESFFCCEIIHSKENVNKCFSSQYINSYLDTI